MRISVRRRENRPLARTCPSRRREAPHRSFGGLILAVVLLIASSRLAHADRVSDLTRTLSHSKHDKARIAAAVSLGRLDDRRAVKPLLRALRDHNRVVRAVAASALGKLGDPVALPLLQRATKDSDEMVRKHAVEAISAIRNHRQPRDRTAAIAKRAGFGHEPRRLGPRPTLYLTLKSTTDESKSRVKKKVRLARAARMRRFLEKELQHASDVTTNPKEAQQFGLERSTIDASITKLDRRVRGPYVEVECQIRLAISDDRGKMLSFLTGGATVQVPKQTFRVKYLPQIHLEAIENAVKSVHQDLLSHLRKNRS